MKSNTLLGEFTNKALGFIQKRLPNKGDGIQFWREMIFIAVFLSLILFGLPAVIQSTFLAFRTGFWMNAVVFIISYSVLILMIAVRQIPFTVRIWISVAVVYLSGVLALYTFGPFGSGRVYLITATSVVCLLLGLRSGLIMMLISDLTLLAIGWLMKAGMTHWPYMTSEYAELNIWFTTSATFILLSAGITVGIGVLVEQLEKRIRREQDLIEHLQDSQQVLEEEIAEHLEAEEALRESETRLSLAVGSARLGLWQRDVRTGEMQINDQWAEMLGFTPDEIEPMINSWKSRLHPDDMEAIEQKMVEHLGAAGEDYFNFLYRLQDKSGEYRWIFDSGQVIERDEEGRAVRVVGVHSDITERKRMEETVQHAEKMAEIGMLAAGVVHEINSPLQVITGLSDRYLRQIKRNKFNMETLPEDLDKIKRNAWRIVDIMRTLLNYARKSVDEAVPQDFNKVVQESLLLIEHQLRSWANIEIENYLDPDLPPVRCQRNSITQVLINLLTNAADAMPSGGTITIRTVYDRDTHQVVLRVEDTGNGIPEEVKERIFDPLFTTKPPGKGTGLGLSIVQEIVTAHGGEIEIYSVDKRGTAVTICLPAVRSD